ncbi:MAG: hypothetical protein HY719_17860 [Planctomycetes bacterium]|nr:hypothetical protein [Planctomycetota bacterium]
MRMLPGAVVRLVAVIGAAALLWGCASRGNPYTRGDLEIRTLAVAPSFVPRMESGNPLSGAPLGGQTVSVETGRVFWHQFTEWSFDRLVDPADVLAAVERDPDLSLRSPADVVKLGRVLGVDAVFISAVTEFDPYNRMPRVGLHGQLFYTKEMTPETANLAEADARGAAGMGGFWGDATKVRNFPVYNRFAVHDSKEKTTQEQLAEYTRRVSVPADWALSGEDFVKVKSATEYIRFIAWRTMNDMYDAEMERQDRIPWPPETEGG